MHERTLTLDEERLVATRAARAREGLGVPQNASNAQIIAAVDGFVFGWQRKGRGVLSKLTKPDSRVDAVADDLGCLWGSVLHAELAWDKLILREEGVDYLVLANQPRSMAIYPIEFVKICLLKPRADCTIELSFNMLCEGRLPADLEPGSYENIMGRIAHIVPR